MICDICGQDGIKIRHITKSYGKRTNLLLIENVPVVSCPHCGESYLTAATLYEIERIKLHRKNFAEERSIPVAGFSDISNDHRQDMLTKASTWHKTLLFFGVYFEVNWLVFSFALKAFCDRWCLALSSIS